MFAIEILCSFAYSTYSITLVYDAEIVSHEFEGTHVHEEAELLIPYKVLKADEKDAGCEICVSSSDTDVCVPLLQ